MPDGELDKLLEDLKKEGEVMMQDLTALDQQLESLQNGISNGSVTKDQMLQEIAAIRQKIGTLKQEDQQEIQILISFDGNVLNSDCSY